MRDPRAAVRAQLPAAEIVLDIGLPDANLISVKEGRCYFMRGKHSRAITGATPDSRPNDVAATQAAQEWS
jgi:hypothetical protein